MCLKCKKNAQVVGTQELFKIIVQMFVFYKMCNNIFMIPNNVPLLPLPLPRKQQSTCYVMIQSQSSLHLFLPITRFAVGWRAWFQATLPGGGEPRPHSPATSCNQTYSTDHRFKDSNQLQPDRLHRSQAYIVSCTRDFIPVTGWYFRNQPQPEILYRSKVIQVLQQLDNQRYLTSHKNMVCQQPVSITKTPKLLTLHVLTSGRHQQ